jgi:hypothetical protein
MRNPWPPAHGTAATLGRLVGSETAKAGELPPATPSDTDRRDHGTDGRFVAGNGAARAKRLRTGMRGSLAALESKADPIWLAADKWGKRFGAHRRGELARFHGGEISGGVGALVEDAALLRADARYWRARGMAEGNPEHTKLAASLLAQVRGCERDAWETAAREAEIRPSNVLPPWESK